MTGTQEPAAESDPRRHDGATPPADAVDRRRPGRREDVAPDLIPLLRYRAPDGVQDLEAPDLSVPTLHTREFVDDLSTARGIVTGIFIALLFWTMLAVLFML